GRRRRGAGPADRRRARPRSRADRRAERSDPLPLGLRGDLEASARRRGEGGVSWKSRLRAAAPGPAAAYLRLKEWARSVRGGGGYLEGIFADIYHGNLWGEPESVSGPGSSLAETAALRRELPDLLAALGVRTLLDAPCGDCHWILGLPLGLRPLTRTAH